MELTASSGGLAIQPSNNILEFLKIAIPAIVTILGFIINYFFTKNSFKKEIFKKKSDILLNSLSSTPLELLKIMDKIKTGDKDALEKMSTIMYEIFIYGTEDSIKIIADMQQYLYSENNSNNIKTIAYLILLTCQLKYDLTGIAIKPDYWFKMKLIDYNSNKNEIIKFNNEIANELELKDFLKIY